MLTYLHGTIRRKFLKKKKSIDPTDPSGLFIRNVADEFERSMQFAGVLQIIVTFVGIGTLIAGIIGISNIMVFIVKERTKELGIRKALGASPSEIIKMILTESIFITAISGFLGMVGGILILNSLDTGLMDYFITRPGVNFSLAMTATIVLILFGVIAGYMRLAHICWVLAREASSRLGFSDPRDHPLFMYRYRKTNHI